MSNKTIFREVAEVVAIALAAAVAAVILMAAISSTVGGRAPSPSQAVPHASALADSEMAPAHPLVDGNGGDVVPLEEVQPMLDVLAAPSVEPASTVTTQALVASPSATAYLVIDPVPATPLTALIAVSPWPQYLWGMVACLVERESGGEADAVGAAGERGLMQVARVNDAYLAGFGITPAQLFDPSENLRAGWLIYLDRQKATGDGFSAWTTRGGCA